jgi:ElaA protein
MTGVEFYQLARLRTAVFVVEQACAYQEIDAIDAQAKHLWALDEDGQVVSYARIFQQEQTVHFGRIIVAPAYRGQKEGHRLIKEVLHRLFMKTGSCMSG